MSLTDVPDIRLEGDGVVFKYLVFDIELSGEKKRIVRGVNLYRRFQGNLEDQIVQLAQRDLEQNGLSRQDVRLENRGGGTLSLNRYYETITLFGSNPEYGREENRQAVAALLERAYPDHQVTWYPSP